MIRELADIQTAEAIEQGKVDPEIRARNQRGNQAPPSKDAPNPTFKRPKKKFNGPERII